MTEMPRAQSAQYQRSSPVYMDNRHSFPPTSQAQSSASAYHTPRGYEDSSSHNVASASFESEDIRAVGTGRASASPEKRRKGVQTDFQHQPESFSSDRDHHSAKLSVIASAAEGMETVASRRFFGLISSAL